MLAKRPLEAVPPQTVGKEGVGMSDSDSDELVGVRELKRHEQTCPAWLPAAVSNFTISFNFASASMASLVMKSDNGQIVGVSKESYDFPEPHWVHTTMKSSVFVGSIVGMLIMGYLGDAIGIRKAMIATNSLVVFSAAASALLTWGEPNVLYGLLVFWRFLLGLGVGGNYPLSAAKASSTGTIGEAVSKAGRAFFWQGPGAVAPYFIGWLLLHMDPTDDMTSIQFRLIMGLGALPACAIVYFMYREHEPPKTSAKTKHAPEEALQKHELRHYRKTLIGTGGTWLFFDIAYYGTAIYAPVIMKSIFEGGAPLTTIALRSAILPFCGIMGTLVGIPLLHIFGAPILNAVGLVMAAVLYSAFIYVKEYVHSGSQANMLFSILCAIFFVVMGGPNIATYVLPVMAFPRSVRATYHGRSGSFGKIGAMLGTFIFPFIMDSHGITGVFMVQSVACFVSAICGIVLVKPIEVDAPMGHQKSKSGLVRMASEMDQDEISEAGLEQEVYYRDETLAEANSVAIQKMQAEITGLNSKIDAIMLHLRIPPVRTEPAASEE